LQKSHIKETIFYKFTAAIYHNTAAGRAFIEELQSAWSSFESVWGSFESVWVSFESVWGFFESVQGSVKGILDSF